MLFEILYNHFLHIVPVSLLFVEGCEVGVQNY